MITEYNLSLTCTKFDDIKKAPNGAFNLISGKEERQEKNEY